MVSVRSGGPRRLERGPPRKGWSRPDLSSLRLPGFCLLLLLPLLPLLPASEATPEPEPEAEPEPCELDDDDIRCFCNFTDPQPDWSSAFNCMVAVEVEMRGGGRSLEHFLRHANTDPQQVANVVKALHLERLTVGAARVPGPLLVGVLRVLGYSRLRELTLEDLEVTGTVPPPPLEATGPALSILRLRNVSWATGGVWLADLQRWLRPGLKVLSIAQARSPPFSCAQLRAFPTLTKLDLSDNPGLGERGLSEALCQHKFPALQDLAVRDAGMETLSGVCLAMAAAGVQPRRLDLSHNALRTTAAAAPECVWPSTLNALDLSFARLEQVPRGLPTRLSVLDLSSNRLNKAPHPDELPKVDNLTLEGNPFLYLVAPNQQDTPNSAVVSACARSALTVGMSGTLAILSVARVPT